MRISRKIRYSDFGAKVPDAFGTGLFPIRCENPHLPETRAMQRGARFPPESRMSHELALRMAQIGFPDAHFERGALYIGLYVFSLQREAYCSL